MTARRSAGVKWMIGGGVAVALLLAGVGQAQAGAIQLTNSGQLDAGDTTAIYPQPENTSVPSPYSQSAGGEHLDVRQLDGSPLPARGPG
jgi:hypothetical protein